MYNRSQRPPQAQDRSGKQEFRINQFPSKNIWPASQDSQRSLSHSDFLRFSGCPLLLGCQRALDAIDHLLLVHDELLVTCGNGAVKRITPSQFFLFITHRADDELVSAERQYLEGCGPETADIEEQANHTHHAICRQLGRA
jgi:hypothetical protein